MREASGLIGRERHILTRIKKQNWFSIPPGSGWYCGGKILTVIAEKELHAVCIGQDDNRVGYDRSLRLEERNARRISITKPFRQS